MRYYIYAKSKHEEAVIPLGRARTIHHAYRYLQNLRAIVRIMDIEHLSILDSERESEVMEDLFVYRCEPPHSHDQTWIVTKSVEESTP